MASTVTHEGRAGKLPVQESEVDLGADFHGIWQFHSQAARGDIQAVPMTFPVAALLIAPQGVDRAEKGASRVDPSFSQTSRKRDCTDDEKDTAYNDGRNKDLLYQPQFSEGFT